MPILVQYELVMGIFSVKNVFYVIDKGYFSKAFLFKPQGGRSPPSSLNRKPRENPLFSL